MSTILPVYTVVIVSLAATLYCLNMLRRAARVLFVVAIHKRIDGIRRLKADAMNKIETDFDFWWSDQPLQAVREKVIEKLNIPDEIKQGLPTEEVEPFIAPAVHAARDIALHLAIHAYIAREEDIRISKLPRFNGLRDKMLDDRDQHMLELERTRTELELVGVDVEELEKRFTPML